MPLPPHVQARRECLSFVVLGATGNLAQRKLLPSLFNLHANGHRPSPNPHRVLRRPDHTDESFREITAASLVQFFNTTPKPSASTSAGVPRQDSVTAGIDDLDAEFRGVLNGAPAPAPVVTSRDIGGCALTTARSSSFVNLEHLAADGNTDDVAANPANASILARRAGAARAARQDAPEFLIRDFLDEFAIRARSRTRRLRQSRRTLRGIRPRRGTRDAARGRPRTQSPVLPRASPRTVPLRGEGGAPLRG